MFFSASIALTSILSFSKITVNSAPVTGRSLVQQACTLPAFSSACTPLNGTVCTNTPGIQSLLLNADADCAAFTLPDCQFTPDQPALEEFSDTSEHLEGLGIQSVQCFENAGTVNGFTQGSPEDIEQEQADAVSGEQTLPAESACLACV